MNVNQLRDAVIMAGAPPEYDLEFEVPAAGLITMFLSNLAVTRIDHIRAVVVLSAR